MDPNDDPEKTVARPVGADLFQQAPLVALGALIANRYRVISKLGAGGMSEVFKCEDLVLKREVAVKLLLPHFKSNEKALKRLHLEAQAAARLDHDHIVKVFEYQISDSGAPFIVMDYIQGKSLDQLISDNGWLEPARVLELSDQICSALQHAHEKNIVHRDLKPSNIMVADRDGKEQVKIVDFGIAKVYEASDQQAITQTGELVGSPLYMSPEQCLGAAIDARSDQYSLACLLFHALAGAPPFTGKNPIETLMKHTTEVAPSLSQASLGKTFPKQIEESLAKALSKEPSQRYLDIQSFRDAFFGKTNPSRSQVSAVAKPALSLLKYVLPTLLLVGTAAFSSWYFAPPHTRKMDQRQLTPPSTAPISSDGVEDYNTNPFFQRQASEERNVLIFQFPPTKYLGELNDHRAQGLCILPYSDRNELRFVAAPNCVAELRRFRPDDLKILTLHSAEEGFLVDKTPGPPVSEPLKNISHMTGLENLVVSHCHLSARDLKLLNPLVSLRRLNLSGNRSIDGQDLAQCAWLSQLTYLDFCSCGEGIDSLLATLSRRSNLEGLALADCKLDENDFRNLGRMAKLRELRLDGVLTNVPDSTLQRAFRNLDQFRCHGGMDGDPREAERFLRTLNPTGLQSLELAKIDLTGNDIVWLGKLKVLEDLLLINCPIPDGSFTKMPNLKNLRSLKITRCKNVKDLLRCLRGSTHIQKLFLSGANLDDSDVNIINGLENLRELTVWRVSNRHMRPDIVLRTQVKD